jgi:hypothetical protein
MIRIGKSCTGALAHIWHVASVCGEVFFFYFGFLFENETLMSVFYTIMSAISLGLLFVPLEQQNRFSALRVPARERLGRNNHAATNQRGLCCDRPAFGGIIAKAQQKIEKRILAR